MAESTHNNTGHARGSLLGMGAWRDVMELGDHMAKQGGIPKGNPHAGALFPNSSSSGGEAKSRDEGFEAGTHKR